MNPVIKRLLSTIAIVIASVAFGVVLSADLGFMRASHAQTAPIQTASGPVASVTIPSFADVAARVMPAVVSITSTEVVKTSDMRNPHGFVDPFEFFFPNPGGQSPRGRGGRGQPQAPDDDEHKQMAGGSGFVISPDGYILTNYHVIEGASKVEVHYGADENGNGGHTVPAKIVGRDAATDIALLKIDTGSKLPYVPLGDSDRIRKGDWAIAIGNPFQFENTLTVGVISAKGRNLGLSEATSSFENFIQTDAAINFGNSGGPLMNINGEVVGINTAIRGGGAQGIGFATPINTAKRLLPALKQGKVTRGYLGMQISEINDKYKQAFELKEERGALVQKIEPGKPADKAGLENGDVIVSIDGRQINNNRQLIDYISYLPVGSNVNITFIRNGRQMTTTAKTAQRPEEGQIAAENETNPIAPARDKLGMSVQELTPMMRQQYGIDDNTKGVVVIGVKEVSAAGDANISEGDVISEVQGEKVNTVGQFRSVIDRFHSGQFVRMYVTSFGRSGNSVSGYRVVQIP